MKIVQTLMEMSADFSEMWTIPPTKPGVTDIIGVYTVAEDDIKLMEHIDLKKYNAIVAGGAALRWYQGMPVDSHDIDIWFHSMEDMIRMNNHLANNYGLKFSSENAETYEIRIGNRDYRVQLIKPKSELLPQEIIDRFDITVAQVATDGERWWIGKQFLQDLRNRRLRVNNYHNKSLKRLVKYWAYGFQPDTETIEAIQTLPFIQWDYESSGNDDYDHIV